MLGLTLVIELLANAGPDFLVDLAGIDRRIHPTMDGEQPFELPQVRLDGGLHIGILKLAGERGTIVRDGPMDLTKRCRRRRMVLEARELRLPAGPELCLHAALDERPPHRWR